MQIRDIIVPVTITCFILIYIASDCYCESDMCIKGLCKQGAETPKIPKCKVGGDIPNSITVAPFLTFCDTRYEYQDTTCYTFKMLIRVNTYRVIFKTNESIERLALCGLSEAACKTCLATNVIEQIRQGKVRSNLCKPLMGLAAALCELANDSPLGKGLKIACPLVCNFTQIDACCFIDISLKLTDSKDAKYNEEERTMCRDPL